MRRDRDSSCMFKVYPFPFFSSRHKKPFQKHARFVFFLPSTVSAA
jgi:hypothetical protein